MKQTNATITEDFEVIFDSIVEETMRRIRCNTLARVISVNGKLLSVQPIIREKVNTQTGTQYLALPVINNVYCVSNQSPQVGDYVACLHFDRGIGDFDLFTQNDGFIDSGTHRHNLTDCIALTIDTDVNSKNVLHQGDTLSAPLTATGGDSATAGKIILDNNNSGQITDNATATLFGFLNTTDLTVGSNNYNTKIRGNATVPKYNSANMTVANINNNVLNIITGNDDNNIDEITIDGITIWRR